MRQSSGHFSIPNRNAVDAAVLPYLFRDELYQFGSPLVVVLAREWNAYSDEDHRVLARLLKAVEVGSDAATILTLPSVQAEELTVYSPTRVLVFGSEMATDIPFCQEIDIHGFRLMRAVDLPALDEARKKELWAALRPMFGIK